MIKQTWAHRNPEKRKKTLLRYRQKTQKTICEHCKIEFVSSNYTKHGFCSYECRILGSIEIDEKGCWNWIGVFAGGGYGRLRFHGKNIPSHRLSYILFKGEIPEGLWVLHKCDNKACCNPDHLFLGTVKDNVRDAMIKGLVNIKGVRNRFCCLTDEQVEELKALREEGKKYTTLARIFNCSEGHLRQIIKEKVRKNARMDTS